MENCVINCLGLSERLLAAAESENWERMMALQAAWQREVTGCMERLNEVGGEAAMAQLSRLLTDIQEKSQALERIIRRLQARQQQELQQLRQAESYLSAS